MANLELCLPELSKKQQLKIAKKNLIYQFKSVLETPMIWRNKQGHKNPYIKKIHNIECIQDTSQPVILLSPHIGAWELIPSLGSIRKLTALYKPVRKKIFEDLLLSTRQSPFCDFVSTEISGLIKLKKVLKNNGSIIILPDQKPQENSGSIASTFFNQPVNTTTLLAKLARKHQAKVVLTYVKRLDNGQGFEVFFKNINLLSNTGELSQDCLLMNQHIEQLVKENPEQYLWGYDRF